jgi:Arc/MetJ family transcription regulator
VAVPVRTVVISVRRAVVNDKCRACTGSPARGPLAKGAAVVAAERVAAWTSSVARIQAACSCRIRSAECERRNAPLPGPAPARVDLASRRAVSEPSQRHR